MNCTDRFYYFRIMVTLCCLTTAINSQRISDCSPPDVPVNGKYWPDNKIFRAGVVVTYSCEKNFILSGKENRTCQATGSWSDHAPFCDSPEKLKNPNMVGEPTKSVYQVIDSQIDTCILLNISIRKPLEVHLEKQGSVKAVKLYIGEGFLNIEISTGMNPTSAGGFSILNPFGLFRRKKDHPTKMCALYTENIDKNEWILIKCVDNRQKSDWIRILGKSNMSETVRLCEIQIYTQDEYDCEESPEKSVPHGYFKISRKEATLICESGYRSQNDRIVCENNSWKSPGSIWKDAKCHKDIPKTTTPTIEDEFKTPTPTLEKELKTATPTLEEKPKTSSVIIDEKSKTSSITIGAVAAVAFIVILLLLGIIIYLIKKQRSREAFDIYQSPESSSATGWEPEYAVPNYEAMQEYVEPFYGSVQEYAPQPPTTMRPTILPTLLSDGYTVPDDCIHRKRNSLSSDISFDTMKKSDLYGS